ncbi:hypothetical protein J6590_021444 [Homalodisca vitripennis]|nr:hypothetical protein J6590_021444 [Homalodisca vitripennis]
MELYRCGFSNKSRVSGGRYRCSYGGGSVHLALPLIVVPSSQNKAACSSTNYHPQCVWREGGGEVSTATRPRAPHLNLAEIFPGTALA